MSHWLWVFGQTRLNHLLLSFIRNQSVIFTFGPHKQESRDGNNEVDCCWLGKYFLDLIFNTVIQHRHSTPGLVPRLWGWRHGQGLLLAPTEESFLLRNHYSNFKFCADSCPSRYKVLLFYSGPEFWVDIGWGTGEKNLIRRSHLDFDCWISVIEFLIVVRCLWFE